MAEIEGMPELQAELAAIKARTQDVTPALLRTGLVVLKAAFDRIDAGGPGWPPNKSHTPILHKTGHLQSSLTVNGADHIANVSGNEIEVGTNVKYARWLQEGTSGSIRQRKQNQIAASLGAAGFLRSVNAERSGGLPPRPFLFIDDQVTQRITDIFAKFIMTGKTGG